MSKSLTINAPQIVQTRNTLNAVPSGSTATPDENVKYVPQDLTEAQQAQARQNIGAVSASEVAQADWDQTDTTAPDYIKNKPTIPAAQVQSDWNQSDNTAVDYIKNKPTIPTSDDFNANDCFTYYWQNMTQGTAYNVLRLNEDTSYIDYMYDNGIKAVLNTSVSDPADLAVGEWMSYGSAMYYKFRPAINGINTLKIRYKGTPIIWISTYAIDNGCIGMLLPEEGTYVRDTFAHGYWAYNVGSSYINNTVICPKWFDNVNASEGFVDATKQVVLNTNPYNVDQVGVNVTDIILTNTSVPASVYTGVQSNTVTSVWLPRTTYNMAILDANWSVYASKLKPYDFLSFGPYNYVVPVAFNSVALTMTDANGTVISGDFVAQNITITPAV